MKREKIIQWTYIVQLIAIAILLGRSFYYGTNDYEYVVAVTLSIAVIGMRFMAPTIPGTQIAALLVIVFAIHEAWHYLLTHYGAAPPLQLITEALISCICVGWFGASWVRAGHVERFRNIWPE